MEGRGGGGKKKFERRVSRIDVGHVTWHYSIGVSIVGPDSICLFSRLVCNRDPSVHSARPVIYNTVYPVIHTVTPIIYTIPCIRLPIIAMIHLRPSLF
jgi:hypothetical protein